MEMVFENGKMIEVKSNEDLIKAISVVLEEKDKEIEKLRTENEEMKSEYYKDESIIKMQKKIDELKDKVSTIRKSSMRGFPISEEEEKKITEWQNKHLKKKHWDKEHDCPKSAGAIGGRFSYHFVPTSIGVIGEVHCTCGKKFCFQELS